MADITVNGIRIGADRVAAEAQNHPAATSDEAAAAAARALVVRELLLQEAKRDGLAPEPVLDDKGRRETEEDALIRQLLETRVTAPEADEETCRRYFERNRDRFRSADLYEPAHILLAASPDDAPAYSDAVAEAEQLIALLQDDPGAFGRFARDRSDCTSRENDGRLGQVTATDVVPEFATFLCNLEEGQLCPVPVKTCYGAHVLRLDRKVEGRGLPFDMVADRIAGYLQEASWRRAVSQYVKLLAGRALIEGIEMEAAETPLLQ